MKDFTKEHLATLQVIVTKYRFRVKKGIYSIKYKLDKIPDQQLIDDLKDLEKLLENCNEILNIVEVKFEVLK